jgi:hypothetical protein
MMRKAAAALVALICWAGLAIQFSATFASQGDVVATLWVLLRFFTVLTNLAVAIVMTAEALGRRVPPLVLGGVTIAIILVGAVYMLFLRGLLELSGGALLADSLLHKVSPIAMALWWLALAPHRALKWDAPAKWAAYPIVYFAYALARAHFDNRYPYPFMDVGKLGWTQVLINAGGIAMAFIVAGVALVALDRILPRAAKGRR